MRTKQPEHHRAATQVPRNSGHPPCVRTFDDLEIPQSPHGYHALSRTRLGWNADVSLPAELVEELLRRQLALPSQDGVSIPLHPVVRTSVLVLLSQLAPRAGRGQGLELLPVTPSRNRIRDLLTLLRLPGLASAGEVVALDTETVGLDLQDAPLEAVLEFRDLHGQDLRRYIRDVRGFVRSLSLLESEEREAAIVDRQEELSDAAGWPATDRPVLLAPPSGPRRRRCSWRRDQPVIGPALASRAWSDGGAA